MNDLPYELLITIFESCHKSINLIKTSKLMFSLRKFINIRVIYRKQFIGMKLDYSGESSLIASVRGDYYSNTPLNVKKSKYISCHNRRKRNKPPVTHLAYHNNFNQQIESIIPTVTHLWFGYSYNKYFNKNNVSMPAIVYIKFGNLFNSNVDNLPRTLTCLVFGDSFNQMVDYLPDSLLHICFGHLFNNSIDKLPQHLISLTLGYHFNQEINLLPKKIKRIILGIQFNRSLDNLPISIKQMKCNGTITKLINLINLKYLILMNIANISFDHFPNLTHLCFSNMNQDMTKLPKSLTHLKIRYDFHKRPIAIPKSIKFVCYAGLLGYRNYRNVLFDTIIKYA